MVDSWLRALEQAGQVISQPVVDEDAAAQARVRELFPDDALYGDSGTGGVRTYTPEQQAANRRAFASFIFGPERESIFGGEASRPERLLRDWGLSEQEFRLSGERFGEGRVGAGFGWGALAIAGAIPIVGDAAQALGKLGRAAERAVDAGSLVAKTEIPVGRWAENPTAETLPLDFVEQFSEFDRGSRPTTSNIDELAESIRANGFDDALILEVDPSGRAVLIEGNHRLAAARALGLDEVPVRVVTSREGARSGQGAEVVVREGLGGGKLLKPSEVFADIPVSGRAGGDVAEVAQEIFSSPRAFEESARTLYHGTPATFDRFESASATWRGRGKRPTSSEGYFYFTDDPNVAATFRQNVSDVSVDRWFERHPDMLFDYEDLRDPEIFQMFIDDVVRGARNKDLQIARDDYAEAWESVRPQDLTMSDVLDFDYPIRAVSPRGQVVETRVFGNELNLTGRLDPSDLPPGLKDALEADRLLQQTGATMTLRSWQGHEKGIPNTVEWMRENGYGRMVVPDAYESGGRSVIALEEYIEFGRPVDEVFESARAAAGRVGGESIQAAGRVPGERLAKQVIDKPDDFVYHVTEADNVVRRDADSSWERFSGGLTTDLNFVDEMLRVPEYLDIDGANAVVVVWRRSDVPEEVLQSLAGGRIHNFRTYKDPAISQRIDDLVGSGMTRKDAINELGWELGEQFAESGRFTLPTFFESTMPEPLGIIPESLLGGGVR